MPDGNTLDRQTIAARGDIKFQRFEGVRVQLEGFGAGYAHPSDKALLRRQHARIFQTIHGKVVDLALAQMVCTDLKTLVILVAVCARHLQLPGPGVI